MRSGFEYDPEQMSSSLRNILHHSNVTFFGKEKVEDDPLGTAKVGFVPEL